jgi:hypothetical protein
VAHGYFADLVAVEDDPLADIDVVIYKMKWVMKGGAVVAGTSSLVKNRSAEGPALSKTKDERVGHPRIVSRVSLRSTRRPSPKVHALS